MNQLTSVAPEKKKKKKKKKVFGSFYGNRSWFIHLNLLNICSKSGVDPLTLVLLDKNIFNCLDGDTKAMPEILKI